MDHDIKIIKEMIEHWRSEEKRCARNAAALERILAEGKTTTGIPIDVVARDIGEQR